MMHGMPARADIPRDGYDGDEADSSSNVIDADQIKGVDAARRRLNPWLARIVDTVEQEAALDVTLCQVAHAAGQQQVTTIPHDFETPVTKTVDELLAIAVDDMHEASFRGTKVTYSLVVELQNGKTERCTFVLEMPRLTSIVHEAPRTPYFPDQQGVTRHFMEQNLQLTEYALDAAGAGKEILLQMIQDLREENRLLKRHQFQRDHEIQKLMDGNLKRNMMVEEHRAKIDQNIKIVEGFKALAPTLLALALPPHIAQAIQSLAPAAQPQHGQPGALPMSSDQDLIDDLILELEQDQPFLMRLFELLGEKPRCLQLLGMIHQSSAARREARAKQQAAEAAARQNNPNGVGGQQQAA